MKLTRAMVLVVIALVVIFAARGGFLFYMMHEERSNQTALQLRENEILATIEAQRQAKEVAENTRPMADKSINAAVPESYPRPESEWKSTEKALYQKLLSAGHFDVLVVPFQVQEYGFDIPTRSLMTAELAQALFTAQKLSSPDPYIVARALGDGERRLNPDEVDALADKLGVKKVIWGYVGHNRKNEMALSIQVQERDANGYLNELAKFETKNFEHIAFTDELPPIEVYQPMLPKILAAIGVDGSALSSPKPISRIDTNDFPETPLDMVSGLREPARDALYFQLLSSLTPYSAERTQARFAEKSLLAILQMSPESPDYRVLKARALMLLGLRPAALHILGTPHTPEEKGLFALLNGNQPDVELYSTKIKPRINKLIAYLDANALSSEYVGANKNKSITTAASLKLPGNIWPFFAARAFTDLDTWAQFDNLTLKQLLDMDFPIKDYTAEGMIRGAVSLGDRRKIQSLVNLSVVNHSRKLLGTEASKWCCESAANHPSRLDYLNLIEAIGDDNLFRRADFLTQVQGVPERSLEFLSQIESVYKAHPQFLLARAQAQISLANSAGAAQRAGLLKSANMSLFDVMYWEQGQSYSSATAFSLVGKSHQPSYILRDNYYAADIPFRSYYPTWEQRGVTEYDILNAEAALKNSTSDTSALRYLDSYYGEFDDDTDKREALFKSIEGRFTGSPTVCQLRADNSLSKGDLQSAERFYSESIEVQPNVWSTYSALGKLFIEQGKLKQAAALFMQYPAFKKDSNRNLVHISNAAYESGSKFYWMGEFSLAKQFYTLASRKETGSNADLGSRIRLKLMKGDYRDVLSGSLERAKRYNNTYSFRDYIELLHVMGKSQEAWDVFNILANQTDDPHIWESVLVGHRKEGKSAAEVVAWVKQEVSHNVGRESDHAANYLLRSAVVDRMPTEALSTTLEGILLPVWGNNYPNTFVVQISSDMRELIMGPRDFRNQQLDMLTNFNGPQRTQVKPSQVFFAEAYWDIRNGNFSHAMSTLQEASKLYDLSQTRKISNFELSYLLPYYAFASAKTGDTSAVVKYMSDFTQEEKGFDYFLAQAVISGIAGKREESVQHLKSALYRRPYTEERPLPSEYQYAEICEWLYEATGQSEYKAIALDWARKNQIFQPWFSWPYAMEAVLSNNKADRKRAIAMASYLDPGSERLGRIPKKERDIAIKEFEGKNPFIIIDSPETQAPI